MISCLLSILLAANSPYTETSVDGLYIGSINPLNGKASINARQIDINQDQLIDLAFTEHVLLQKEGSYSQTNPVDIPLAEQGPEIDFFNNILYLKFPDGLKTYQYLNNSWEQLLDASITWPHQQTPPAAATDQPAPPSFEHFVYDIDEDGTPELLFPMQDGLHVYRFTGNTYQPDPPLNLFPKSRLIPIEAAASASNPARHLTFPDQHIAFHAAIENGILTIVTTSKHENNAIHFTTTSHPIASTNLNSKPDTTNAIVHQSPAYPNHMLPCKLNPDSRLDFAGGTLDYASTLAILTPIYTTTIYTTPDEKPQSFLTKSFTPHTDFTDFNHDGYFDLVQEYTHITDGGLRETLNRFTTRKKFRHTISVHLQRKDHIFSKRPDYSKTITIKLDQTPIRLSNMFQRYQAGKLLNLTGDFNHDAHNDILVQTSENELALFLSSKTAFAEDPDLLIPIQSYETFHVIDLNVDGYSDILFQGAPDEDSDILAPARILLFNPNASP